MSAFWEGFVKKADADVLDMNKYPHLKGKKYIDPKFGRKLGPKMPSYRPHTKPSVGRLLVAGAVPLITLLGGVAGIASHKKKTKGKKEG